MKRITSIILVIVLLVSCVPFSAGAVATIPCGNDLTGDNINGQDYSHIFWSNPVDSYLSVRSDGNLMTFTYDAGALGSKGMIVSYYTPDYQLIKSVSLDAELELFGGFYEMENGFYLLTGQDNYEESAQKEVLRLTKYDKNWNRIGAKSFYGLNTVAPFSAGSARFAHNGTTLVIRTCHKMYTDPSDWQNHQANMTIAIDTEEMDVIESFHYVGSGVGYVSHSFNQFIEYIDGQFVAVDHGDGHPRSICLVKYDENAFKYGYLVSPYVTETATMLEIPGIEGANYTGVTVGGFTDSATSYLVAGNSELETPDARNIYLSVLPKNGTEATVRYLTDYTEWGATTPHLVKISDQHSMILWSVGNYVFYQMLDANGNDYGELRHFNAALSDCKPIVADGKVMWYIYDGNDITFFTINISDLSKTTTTTVNYGHNYVEQKNKTHHWDVCTKCGGERYKQAHSASDATAYNKFTQTGMLENGCLYCGYIFKSEKLTAEMNPSGSSFTATLKTNSTTLTEDTDYQLYWTDPTFTKDSNGAYQYVRATLQFRGKGKYSGTHNKEVYSIPYACNVGQIKKQQYTGKAIVPEIEITCNGKTLKKDVDYTVSYKNNVGIGTATAIIQGKGSYFGTTEKEFPIVASLAHPFKDVSKTAWYQNSVQYVHEAGLMNGMSATTFEPEGTTTRAQLVTVLHRMENEPILPGNYPFVDVPPQAWCTMPVLWAYKNKIVNGTSERTFTPNAPITREQIATILYRYTKDYKGENTQTSASIAGFPDAKKVSDYAKEAMQWAYAEGLITGTNKNGVVYLDPQGNATRAQIATILMRFDKKF